MVKGGTVLKSRSIPSSLFQFIILSRVDQLVYMCLNLQSVIVMHPGEICSSTPELLWRQISLALNRRPGQFAHFEPSVCPEDNAFL